MLCAITILLAASIALSHGANLVVPAVEGVVPELPDSVVPFRQLPRAKAVPREFEKLPKESLDRQADDGGLGTSNNLSPSLAALRRLAGIQGSSPAFGSPSSSGSSFGAGRFPNIAGSDSSFSAFGSQGAGFPNGGSLPSNFPALAGAGGLGSLGGFGGQSGGLGSLGGFGGSEGGLGSLGGFGGSEGGLGGLGGFGGQSGLGGFPQSLAGASGFGAPQGQTGGLLNVLGSLGGSLGRSLGIGSLLRPNEFSDGSAGPTFAGLPSIPGAPYPGAGGLGGLGGLGALAGGSGAGGGQGFDFLNLIGSLTRRAFNGSSLAEALPPNRIQSFADNVTEQLVPDLSTVDLSKYMGRWFEGINSPKASNQRCPVHHYGGLTQNGQTATYTALKIYRDGSEFGQVQYSIGYAFRGGRHPGMLQMHSSESKDPTPYWIYNTGPIGKDSFGNDQYEWVVVSNWIKYPVMVLTRDPDEFKKKYYVDVLRWLEDNGFITDFTRAFNLIQPVDYSNCQYEDSTFAAFGKR